MRIAILSDTHYIERWRDPPVKALDAIAEQQPDCLVLAGDIAATIDGFDRMLALCRRVRCPCLVIAGNHDLWTNSTVSTERLWTETLPRLTRDNEAIWLEAENWIKAGAGVCGTIGWYDYTGRDPSIGWTTDDYFLSKGSVHNDGNRMNWVRRDIDFAQAVGDACEARLAALESDPAVRQVVVVTHVPVFSEAIINRPDDKTWQINNAYFFNLTLGERIRNYAKVTHVVSGHIHRFYSGQVVGRHHPIAFQVVDADYGEPGYVILDLPGDRPFPKV